MAGANIGRTTRRPNTASTWHYQTSFGGQHEQHETRQDRPTHRRHRASCRLRSTRGAYCQGADAKRYLEERASGGRPKDCRGRAGSRRICTGSRARWSHRPDNFPVVPRKIGGNDTGHGAALCHA